MMTCPKCDRREPSSTVKCECGFWFPPAMRKKEQRWIAHVAKEVVAKERVAVRYPALRILARIYRALAVVSLLVGGAKTVLDAAVFFASSSSTSAARLDSTEPVLAVVVDLLGTALAVVTTFAAAEAIRLLLDLSTRERASAPAHDPAI